MKKTFLYKMTGDSGGAPCVRRGQLSLAICKPAIRRTAEPGYVILGFAGNSLYSRNCLIFAARLDSPALSGQKYYTDAYIDRPDCIYKFTNGRYIRRAEARFHHRADDLTHDLGKPPSYFSAKVLLVKKSSDFRYWRTDCPIPYQEKYPELATFIHNMGRSFRINLPESVRNQLQSLEKEIWMTPETSRETDIPSRPVPERCGGDEGCIECSG